MAKPPKAGKCVHCLQESPVRNWDHVFPRSWFPDTTAPNQAKWQVPSCPKCNSALGAIESAFLAKIALCLDPNDPASKSIVQKNLRSLKPENGKNPTDKRARLALAKKISSTLLFGDAIPTSSIYPAMGEKWGRPSTSGVGVTIEVESFRRITEKIIRGITYWNEERYIELPYKVHFFPSNAGGSDPIQEELDRACTKLVLEPGIQVRFSVAQEDGRTALYEIEFWKQFKTYAAVIDNEP